MAKSDPIRQIRHIVCFSMYSIPVFSILCIPVALSIMVLYRRSRNSTVIDLGRTLNISNTFEEKRLWKPIPANFLNKADKSRIGCQKIQKKQDFNHVNETGHTFTFDNVIHCS